MGIEIIKNISHKYGRNPQIVLAGGGNTSYKDESFLYVKGSGVSLATISKDGFVKMSREKLWDIFDKVYSDNKDEREAEVLNDMLLSRCEGEEAKRPSVETLLHNIFSQPYVLHVHPTKVNGITCSFDGKAVIEKLFPNAIWVEETEPGYVLAIKCRERICEYEKRTGNKACLLFLQNHGVFFAAENEEEMDILVASVMKKIDEAIIASPDLTVAEPDFDKVCKISPMLRMLYSDKGEACVKFTLNREIERLSSSYESFEALTNPLTPDHMVYCKAKPLFIEGMDFEIIKNSFADFVNENGYAPKVVFVKGIGMFAIGSNPKDANTVTDLWIDAIKIYVYAQSFGGLKPMDSKIVDFIANWEVETYRSKVALKLESGKKFNGKIAIVTGAAKGLGKEIALCLAKEGASVVVADRDIVNGEKTAKQIIELYGNKSSMFVYTDVTDEKSVNSMVNYTVLQYGGVDILVSNAGIIKAGSIEETTLADFEKITAVNYTAYFNCVKSVVKIMKVQKLVNSSYLTDIIEINSKSGINGSAMNFAYSGSKFGGIGLTQSFALELAQYGIKVNAICPGNLLDGELWSDPTNGLFVQFLHAGKVDGAKTVEDVRRAYEKKVPLGRGCRAEDVCLALCYAIEQKYETGQVIPVTGGQVMLK